MMSLFEKKVKPEDHRFFVITQVAYIVGALGHVSLCFRFWTMQITEMFWFNLFFSVPIFMIAFFINRKGWHNLAFSMGFAELLIHQALGIYYLGWDNGFQYWLIYLIGLCFFNAKWNKLVRLFCFATVMTTFMALFIFFRTPQIYTLTEMQYNSAYLMSAFTSLLLLTLLINYYVQTGNKAETNLKSANRELSEKNIQIEKTLQERNQALQQLNRELQEAADYVKTILPQPISGSDIETDWRFIPSASVGGDAFGYHWLDEDHFTFYLIDVSGHGVGAALLSVSVMNALRSQSLPNTDFKDPEQILASLNVAFPGEENNDMFFTIWYGVYNKRSRELTYASGGHPPAILIGDHAIDDARLALLRTPNNVIGAMPDVTYKKNRLIVAEKTTLYVFSDGVYEVNKSDGSMWRFKDFSDFMDNIKGEGQSRIDSLYQHVKNIGNLKNLEDDFTIVEVAFG